jgi:hypothetical protein
MLQRPSSSKVCSDKMCLSLLRPLGMPLFEYIVPWTVHDTHASTSGDICNGTKPGESGRRGRTGSLANALGAILP